MNYKTYWSKWAEEVTHRGEKSLSVRSTESKRVWRCATTDPETSLVYDAKKYHKMGLPVVPVKIAWNKNKNQWDKKPLTEWKRWQTEKQTDIEFDSLDWSNANGLGVILGWKTERGYLCVVDYDVKGKATDEVKGYECQIRNIFATSVERTANNGLHFLYFSEQPVKNDNRHHDTCGLELFGERLVVMAPSLGYQAVGDSAIQRVPDVTSLFNDAVKTLGVEVKEKAPEVTEVKKSAKQSKRIKKGKIRPCVEALLKNNALDHDKRCIVAFEYLNAGYQLKDVLRLFQNQTDFDYATTEQQLTHAIATGYLPYSEQKLKELSVCLGPSCPLYGKQQVQTPSVVLEDGRIAEQGYDGKAVYYIVYNPATKAITREGFIETDDKTYMPISNDDVARGLVKFPSEATEYVSNAELDKEIKAYLNRWHEQLDPVQRQLDVYYIKETYVKDLMPQIAYRRNLATFGSGKSAFLEVLGSICYRPINLAGSSTEAAIRRKFDLWQGTALIDEADFKNSSLFDVIIKILNIGYDRKTGFYQCCDENDISKVLNFNVYGPKVIGTRERYSDVALESRCLTFIGRDAVGKVPLYRMERFEAEAQDLRNKLLMWRFRNYDKLKEKLPKLEEIDADQKIYGKIDARNRVKQLTLPLLLMAETEADQKGIVNFAADFNASLQNLDEEQGLKDKVEKALQVLFKGKALTEPQYKVYLHDFAEALEITDETERPYWCRDLAKYFKKRTAFTIKAGSGNRKYVLLPSYWIREILKKAPPPEDETTIIQYLPPEVQQLDLPRNWRPHKEKGD